MFLKIFLIIMDLVVMPNGGRAIKGKGAFDDGEDDDHVETPKALRKKYRECRE
jgi:hypothetical protein